MKSKIELKKVLSLLVVVALFFGVFSSYGCRTKTPTTTQKKTTDVELTYYKVFDGADVMDPIINAYLSKNPGLKINYKKFSDFDEYQKVILSEMAEGKGPDIFSMPNWWYASNLGKVAPLPEKLGTVDVFADVFVDVANSDLVRVDKDGNEQVYGVPMTVDTLALYYNKDQYEDRIPERGGKPAKTWEGIKEDVALLNKPTSGSQTDFDVSGIAMGRADNISRAVDILYLLFLQYGVDFYNTDISEATFAARSAEGLLAFPGLEALNLFVSFADPNQKYYTWGPKSADPNSDYKEIDAFATGKVSMMIGFAYTYNDIVNRMDVLKAKGQFTINKSAIRIAAIPQVYDPDASQGKRVTYASYFAETVSRNCKNPDAAWEFLVYLTSSEALQKYFDKTHKPTSRRDMIEEQKKDPNYGIFAQQLGYAESFPIVDYNKYKEIFKETLARAYADGGGMKSNLVDAQDKINAMLPKDGFVNEKKVLTAEEEKAKQDKQKADAAAAAKK
jgi:ABC-type glycerol-3-phosphate transport system substrate-binding protein